MERAFIDMLDQYRRTLSKILVNVIVKWRAFKDTPIYKSIKDMATDPELMKDYDREEAWKHATNKRKYLFEKLIRSYEPPEISALESNEQEGIGQGRRG